MHGNFLKICKNNIVNGIYIITFMERKTNHLNFHYCFQFDPVTEKESEIIKKIHRMKINIEGGKTADKVFSSFFSILFKDTRQQTTTIKLIFITKATKFHCRCGCHSVSMKILTHILS